MENVFSHGKLSHSRSFRSRCELSVGILVFPQTTAKQSTPGSGKTGERESRIEGYEVRSTAQTITWPLVSSAVILAANCSEVNYNSNSIPAIIAPETLINAEDGFAQWLDLSDENTPYGVHNLPSLKRTTLQTVPRVKEAC